MSNGTPAASAKGHAGIVRKGLSLSVLTLGSRILGLVREMTKARFMGTSAYSDAFGVAFMIPNLFRRLFAENTISVAFIPTFRGYLEDADTPQGRQDAQRFVSATFTLITLLVTAFVAAGMLLSPLILRIFFRTSDGAVMAEAVLLTRIMFPYLLVISVAAFFQGMLNGLKIFSPSGFTPILFNGIVIAATYLLAPHMANPARAMATGVIVGGCVQALFQLPFVLHNRWYVSFTSLRAAFSNPGTRKVIALVLPTIVGMAAYQLNDIVSSALATRAGEGVYSSLGYSLRVQELILGICAVTIGTVILPDLTEFAHKNAWTDFSAMLLQSVRIMAFIAIPVSVYAFIMARPLITLLFARGMFDAGSVAMTVRVFRCHVVGLFFIAVNRIVSPAFYAQQDTKSPTVAGLVNFAVNICLAVALVRLLSGAERQGAGIACALTAASVVNTVCLFAFLRRNGRVAVGKIVRGTILYMLRMLVFSAVAAVPVCLLRDATVRLFAGHGLIVSQGAPVVLLGLLFAVVGVALSVLTRDPLVLQVRALLRRTGRRNGESE